MKLVIDPLTIKDSILKKADGIILSLKDFSVQSEKVYTIEQIKDLKKQYPNIEIFVNINKIIYNKDLKKLEKILLELEKINIQAVLFYDLSILQIKKEKNLKIDLVWSQTHMVNNKNTCNFYQKKGVKYALISKEITLEEIKEIQKESNMLLMIEVVGRPSIAFSKRKLLTNFYKNIQKPKKNKLEITEKQTNQKYELSETEEGTSLIRKEITNATQIIKELNKEKISYIIMREYGIEKTIWEELINDTKIYLQNNCQNEEYIEKYKILGKNTNFFFQKTIYQVKKND